MNSIGDKVYYSPTVGLPILDQAPSGTKWFQHLPNGEGQGYFELIKDDEEVSPDVEWDAPPSGGLTVEKLLAYRDKLKAEQDLRVKQSFVFDVTPVFLAYATLPDKWKLKRGQLSRVEWLRLPKNQHLLKEVSLWAEMFGFGALELVERSD